MPSGRFRNPLLHAFSLHCHKKSVLSTLGAASFLLVVLVLISPVAGLPVSGEEKIESKALDLCALQKDFDFFTDTPEKSEKRAEALSCEDLMTLRDTLLIPAEEGAVAESHFVAELRAIVLGFPIEVMSEAIAAYDREIAGLIVGIGKKESNWGKRTPKLGGEECYNFWGYRAPGDRGLTPDGYGCWHTPEAAVKAIGDRLAKLRDLRASSTPERMIVWKCGSSCATHSPESVRKWIADVNIYYREIAGKQ